MTSSKDIIQETHFPEEQQAEEMARLEQQAEHEKQQALLNFQEKALEIDGERARSAEENTARYDADLDNIAEAFRNAPQASWSQYQAADTAQKQEQKRALLRYSNKNIEIKAEHEQQIEKNTAYYDNQIIEIEGRFKANRLSIVQKYQRIREHHEEKVARALDERIASQSWDTYDESVRQAKEHLDVQSKAAHVAAVQETNAEVEKFHQAKLAVREESYLMLAAAIGLDGITDDIWGYVSKSHKYASIQPLLGYTDLRLALAKAVKSGENSTLIDHFYCVTTEDETVNVSELEVAVQSLDLAATSQLFKHECVFMAAPSRPEANKLYIDLKRNRFSCSLRSPDGNVMSKSYTKDSMVAGNALKEVFQHGTMREYIQAESLYFVMDVNYGTRASTFDAFTSLIHSQKGFKAHVINTIAIYNRELAYFHGFDMLKLCKKHLSYSSDQGSQILEETPLYQLSEAHNAVISEINKRYRDECVVLAKEYDQAIFEAEKLRHEMRHSTHDVARLETQCEQEEVVDESAFSPAGVDTHVISPLAPQLQAKADDKSRRGADKIGFFEDNKCNRKPVQLGLDGMVEDENSETSVSHEYTTGLIRIEETADVGKISGSDEYAEFDEKNADISRLLGGMGFI